MKRILLAAALCIAWTASASAQQTTADAPATRADIERYLEVTHAREMMKNVMDVMAKQMQQMVHDQVAQYAAKLPPGSEEQINKMTQDMLKSFPIDEMLDAMIPVYQKHWTKGDVEAMLTFYSSPTGQKMLKEMPATMAETMQAIQPLMQKQMATMMDRVQQEVAQMAKEPAAKPGKSPAAANN